MEVIDIGLDDLEETNFGSSSSSNNNNGVNFGGGIELLMNDKKRSSSNSSTKIDLQELDNLEHQKIRNNYLPLNFQNTLGILTSNHRKILTQSKKRMRS